MNNKCFIIMPFSATKTKSTVEWTEIYQYLFLPAWKSFGIACERINIPRGQITKEIIKELFEAQIVFADLTDSNPNVMYELGIRHAFKKPSLIVKYEGAEIPFDIKAYMIHEYQYTPYGLEHLKIIINSFLSDLENRLDEPDNPVWEFLRGIELEKSEHRLENIEKTGIELMIDLKKSIEETIQSDYGYNEIMRNFYDTNIETRKRTIRGVAEIKTKRFMKPIIELLEDNEDDIRIEAIEALGKIGSREAIEPLLNFLSKDSNDIYREKKAAIEALGKIGRKESIQPLLKILSEDPKEIMREEALKALELINDTSIAPVLLKMLKSDSNDNIRSNSARILGLFGGSIAISALSEALESDPDIHVRSSAARALCLIGTQKSKSYLIKAAKKDQSAYVRIASVESLGKAYPNESLSVLIDILKMDKNEDVRVICVKALKNIGDPIIIPILGSILKTDRSGKVKNEIIDFLASFQNLEVINFLNFAINDDDIADYDDIMPISVGYIAQEAIKDIQISLFLNELQSKFKEKVSDISQEHISFCMLLVPTGFIGINFVSGFNWEGFNIGLTLNRIEKDENEKILNFFIKRKDLLEKELGENIIFNSDFEHNSPNIYILNCETKITDELKSWALTTMLRFYNSLKPLLGEYFCKV